MLLNACGSANSSSVIIYYHVNEFSTIELTGFLQYKPRPLDIVVQLYYWLCFIAYRAIYGYVYMQSIILFCTCVTDEMLAPSHSQPRPYPSHSQLPTDPDVSDACVDIDIDEGNTPCHSELVAGSTLLFGCTGLS